MRLKAIKLACVYKGDNFEKSYDTYNITQAQRQAKASNATTGLITLNLGSLIAGAAIQVETGENGEDLYGYHDVRLAVD